MEVCVFESEHFSMLARRLLKQSHAKFANFVASAIPVALHRYMHDLSEKNSIINTSPIISMKRTKKHFLAIVTTTVAAFLVTSTVSQAALITWTGAQDITGDSNVANFGNTIGAFNVGDGGVSNQTVNGVNFQSFALDSSSGPVSSVTKQYVNPDNSIGPVSFTLATPDIFLSDNTAYGSAATPFANLSTAYKALLASSTIVSYPNTFTLTMSGLSVGRLYTFEWWSNTSGPGSQNHRAATGLNGVTLIDNTTGIEGGLGQFAIGTFTADSSTQVLTFSAVPPVMDEFAQINAFQLRSVPETANVLAGLLPLGILLIGLFYRRGAISSGQA